MKTSHRLVGSFLAVLLLCPFSASAFDLGGALKGAGSVLKGSKQVADPTATTGKGLSLPGGGGSGVFSDRPIDPANPPATMEAFKAGDRIYGLLQADKPWKELNKNNDYIILWVTIDGEQKIYKSIGLKRPDLVARDYFLIDIAPEPADMTSYSDRDVLYPEVDGYKFGPELFTKYLSELSPGEHRFRLEVKAYNKVFAAGEFKISGSDFSRYATLLTELQASTGQQQTMPKVGMTDEALQKQMSELLRNAGWPALRRLLIVDKDWWIDRVDGGNTAVKSRHIEAAAATKEGDGSYTYRHVTFHQPMLITGAWGKLELTHTGAKKPIPEANIDK